MREAGFIFIAFGALRDGSVEMLPLDMFTLYLTQFEIDDREISASGPSSNRFFVSDSTEIILGD